MRLDPTFRVEAIPVRPHQEQEDDMKNVPINPGPIWMPLVVIVVGYLVYS